MNERIRLVGNRLKLIRIQKGLGQNEVAKLMGISQAHLSNIEGGRSNITLSNLLKLHDVLEASMADFFMWELRSFAFSAARFSPLSVSTL